jgi:hypothetical protein
MGRALYHPRSGGEMKLLNRFVFVMLNAPFIAIGFIVVMVKNGYQVSEIIFDNWVDSL